MAEKFAFEAGEVSIAFDIMCGALGDTLISKSVFDALIKLAPNCKIDIFSTERAKRDSFNDYVKAFYGDSKNLNLISDDKSFYTENAKKYDLAVSVWHMVLINAVNEESLKRKAAELFESVQKIKAYNRNGFDRMKNISAMVLFNVTRAHILGINRYTCLSCGGALPIHDNRVEIPLLPDGERAFKELGLSKNYITIGSNMKNAKFHRHTLKEWPSLYFAVYVTLLNQKFPEMQIVQLGGGGVEKIPSADRYLFDADLELVKHVLKNSRLHIDCESGLVHLATQLGTKCLVLFGPTDEKYFGFKENINLSANICRPCCHAWDNGSQCLRGDKEPPCIFKITPQTVYEATCNYLENKA